MHLKFWAAVVLILSACSSSSKKQDVQVYNSSCAPTPIQLGDMKQFNIQPAPGKITVMRIFRSSCPTCKEDLQQIGLMFKTGKWKAENVQLVLVSYVKENVESRETFDAFVRSELSNVGFPIEAAQIIFLNKTYPTLLTSKAANGELIFPDWRAVPYSMIFGKDGRLAYRGQFTIPPSQQDRNYDFITEIQKESCTPAPL